MLCNDNINMYKILRRYAVCKGEVTVKFLKAATLLSAGFIAAALCSLCAGAEDYTGGDDTAVFDGAYFCSEDAPEALSKTAEQPNAVSGLSFSSRSDSSIILKWGTVSKADGYILEYLDGEKFTKLATFTAGDEMTYGCYDLSPATLYKFRIRCYVNDNGNRIYSDYSKVLEVRTYPAVMTAMSQTDATVDSVTLQWYRNSTAKGYVIEKAVGDGWERVITIKDGNTTQYTVTGLASGTTYQFRIKRYIYDGEQMLFGGYSSVTTANTVPSAPTGFSVSSKTNTSVSLKWNKQNADGFILDIYDGSSWTNKIINNGYAVSYNVTGLKSGASYKFRINAYKGDISGDKTYPYCSGGYALLAVNTKPDNITGLKATTSTATSVTLGWNKNTSASGYIIERYNGSSWVRAARISANSTVSYTVSSLSAGKEYKFRIKAFKNFGGVYEYSGYTNLTACTKPTAVSSFKLKSRTNTSITLSWAKNSTAQGYILERYDGSKWATVKKITSNATTSYTVTGLKSSTSNKFRIKAYYSTLSSAYTYTTVNTLPSAMTGFKASAKTNNSITLGWSKNSSADGYIIEYYSGGKWVRLKKLTSNTYVSFKFNSLKPSTTYKFRIKAYKTINSAVQYSVYTNLTVNTKPNNVTGVYVSKVTMISATLSWNKNTTAGGYIVERYDGTQWVRIKKCTSNTVTSCAVLGLKPGTTYKFRIKAYKTINGTAEYSGYTYCNVITQ